MTPCKYPLKFLISQRICAFTVDLVTFTEEILKGKIHFLYNVLKKEAKVVFNFLVNLLLPVFHFITPGKHQKTYGRVQVQ